MKKVLITGWNKWIGLATTELFLEKGFEVVIVARDFSNFTPDDKNIQTISFDLSQVEKIDEIYKVVWEVDVLINNAGIMYGTPYNEYTSEKKDMMMRVNLEAQIELIKVFTQNNKSLRIVNNASIAWEIGHPDIWYGITKAWVINMTKSFAKILGPEWVVVNCMSAWPAQTDLLDTIPEERKNQIKQSLITGRFALPEEIAQTFYFLWVDCPAYINGTCIDVNNGAFMR